MPKEKDKGVSSSRRLFLMFIFAANEFVEIKFFK